MNYEQKFNDDFRELFTAKLRENEKFGVELWSALANVSWINRNDPNRTDCGESFRSAGSLISSMLCKGDYMDWYCSGTDGVVSEFVSQKMAERGWKYKLLRD